MIVPLQNLNTKKSKEFLNYLIAAIKEKNKMPFLGAASSSFSSDGQYETTIQDIIRSSSEKDCSIQWRILQKTNGTISLIEALSPLGGEPIDCKDEINEFILRVTFNALSEKKQSYFHRSYYCYLGSVNLTGELWLNSRTRIAPLFEDDESFFVFSEKVLVIDQKVDAIDDFHSRQIGEEKAIEYASYISFLLDLGLYLPVREERWVIDKDPSSEKRLNKRLLTGIIDESRPIKMPKKGELNKSLISSNSIMIDFERNFFERITFPVESRKIIRSISISDIKNQEAFFRCCRLYQLGLRFGLDHPTIKLAYFVAAIEAITKTTNIATGFSDFVLKYIPKANKKLLDILYDKIRSAHWHTGIFYLGENEAKTKEFILDYTQHFRDNIMMDSHRLLRNAIISWLFTEIVNKNST